MDIKLSDIFKIILQKHTTKNSIISSLLQMIGIEQKQIKLNIHHLILLHNMLDENFYPWVSNNLNILNKNPTEQDIFNIQDSININVLQCPQYGCTEYISINKVFKGMHFIGMFNCSEFKNEPLKRQKVIYFPEISRYYIYHLANTDATRQQKKYKKMDVAYLSKKGLMNNGVELYGLFNATTGKLIAFVDFSNQ